MRVDFPGATVLHFEYSVIQLNRLPWRRFVNRANPVASALMAKMRMSPRDRPNVKLQCLRLLATLELDPAKSSLIGVFIDNYLRLNADELKRFERELGKLPDEEKERTMEYVTSWKQEGIEEGLRQGLQTGLQQAMQNGLQQGARTGAVHRST